MPVTEILNAQVRDLDLSGGLDVLHARLRIEDQRGVACLRPVPSRPSNSPHEQRPGNIGVSLDQTASKLEPAMPPQRLVADPDHRCDLVVVRAVLHHRDDEVPVLLRRFIRWSAAHPFFLRQNIHLASGGRLSFTSTITASSRAFSLIARAAASICLPEFRLHASSSYLGRQRLDPLVVGYAHPPDDGLRIIASP